MRANCLKVFTNNQIDNQDSEFDLTSVSSIYLNDSIADSFSHFKTSTFDEIQMADSLEQNELPKDKPPPVPPRKHLMHKKNEHFYINIDNNNNTPSTSEQKTPVNKSRFRSPEKLPLFYYSKENNQTTEDEQTKKMVDQETQTNVKCILLKQSELKKTSPEKVLNYFTKEQEPEPEQTHEHSFPSFNIYSKFKNWVSKLNMSPLLSNSTHQEQESIDKRHSRSKTIDQPARVSLTPTKRADTYKSPVKSMKINQRASSLTNRLPLKSPNKEVSFSHLNEFITDNIGADFFKSVLGKTNSVLNSSSSSKLAKTENKIAQTNSNVNSSIITFDDSALITNDETIIVKKSNSKTEQKCANENMDDEDENDQTFTESIVGNDLDDLAKTFQNLNTNSLTEQLKFINQNLNESNKKSKNSDSPVIDNIKNPILLNNNYSNELYEQIENKMNTTDSSEMIMSNMFNCFQINPNQIEWREGHIKSAFNYLLIDPRISQNLPVRAKYLNEKQVFRAFIASIFYIGKGTRARPYAHLQDSIKVWKHEKNQVVTSPQSAVPKRSKKIERIINIWEDNYGVVSLHCFQNVIPSEAYTREAAMIDAIGIQNLTNVKKGNYYGESKDWSLKHRCQLGTILLKKACAIFLAEGERQLNPIDIKI